MPPSVHHEVVPNLQVSEKNRQLESASAQLAGSLTQMHALVASASSLTDQLASSQQLLSAEQASSQLLGQQLKQSQSDCK